MTLKIYTRTGDEGDTGLFGGGRVGKDDPRVEAYGAVDELNAALGWARSAELMPRIDEVLAPVQRDLFAIGALLATPDHEKMKEQLFKARIDDARIADLERAIDFLRLRFLPFLRCFHFVRIGMDDLVTAAQQGAPAIEKQNAQTRDRHT